MNQLLQVQARANTDDYVQQIEFDAGDWFKTALDQEIIELAQCDWAGDYPADAVLEHFQASNADVNALFSHLHTVNASRVDETPCGFYCAVDRESAIQWLQQNRLTVLATLKRLAI